MALAVHFSYTGEPIMTVAREKSTEVGGRAMEDKDG
jgi:hypothetical protein